MTISFEEFTFVYHTMASFWLVYMMLFWSLVPWLEFGCLNLWISDRRRKSKQEMCVYGVGFKVYLQGPKLLNVTLHSSCSNWNFRMLELEWNLETVLSSTFVDEETDYMAAQRPQLGSGRYRMRFSIKIVPLKYSLHKNSSFIYRL